MLVETKHICNFALPFFHMRSEPFWFLVTKPTMKPKVNKSKSIKSFKNLKETIAFAEIAKNLFTLLLEPVNRILFIENLLNDYFPSTKSNFDLNKINTEELKIESQILNKKKLQYQINLRNLRDSLDDDKFEEELFIRGSLFKE